jgi:Flp pilus assembly protein TadG
MAPPLQHRQTRPRLRGDDAGVALLEFALILPVLAILVFGTIDLGRAFSLKSAVTNMAREGAFQLVVDACPLDGAKNAAKAENAELSNKVTIKIVQGTDTSAPEVTCPASGVFTAGTELTVVVTTKMSIIAPLVGTITGDPVDVTGTATARMP